MNDDNPPAFPRGDAGQYGMSLRDYFAGQALIGILASLANPNSIGKGSIPDIGWARTCYAMADAMLAARKEGGKV